MSKMSGKSELNVANGYRTDLKKAVKEGGKGQMSCAAEMRALPAAFSLAEPMKDPGSQMPTASYTFGIYATSFSDWDA